MIAVTMSEVWPILFDAAFSLLGLGLIFYSLGWFIAVWGDRPTIIRHPITMRWVPARSIRLPPEKHKAIPPPRRVLALPPTQQLPE